MVCAHGGAYDIGWSDNHAAITFDNPFNTPQCGGLMEAFMIRTGFYDKCVSLLTVTRLTCHDCCLAD